MQLFRLIWPVIVVVLLSLFALVAVAGILANRFDQDAIATQRTIIENAVTTITHNLDVLAEDNSWWDDAVDNMVITENASWMNRTLGDIASSRNYVDGILALRSDYSVLYHSALESNLPPVEQWLSAGLQNAINNMNYVNGNVGVTAQGFLKYDGQLIALGMSFVQPSGYKVYNPPLPATQRPILILYEYMQEEEYRKLEQNTGASYLKYSSSQPIEGLSNYHLHDINGNIAGFINWQPFAPGSKLLENLAVPAIILLLIVLFVCGYFLHQARTLILRLEHANNAKMSFLASMSHEVRTPLNTIIGFAEIIELELYGKIGSAKNKEYINIVRNSGEHLLSIVNDILDISKLEAGRFEVDVETFKTNDVITQCLKIIEVSANGKSIRLVPDLANFSINSDERIMRQTLLNILSNAVKFTPKKGQVSILSEKKDDRFIITVSDNGPGMTPEEIRVALEPFGQVQNSEIGSSKGTGLGLPIVDRFMKLVDGKLTIRSAPGYGTSVSLEFPVKVDGRL